MADPAVAVAPPAVVAAAERGMGEGLHPGMQVYASIGGEVVADFAVGTGGAVGELTPATPIPWFSATKPVVSMLVAQLVDGGRLRFDDAVVDHLPDFGQGGKEAATIAHLLTHTVPFATDLEMKHALGPWHEATAAVCALPLRPGAVVGRTARYTGVAAWHALAAIVCDKEGAPLAELAQQKVFRPLGVHDCWLGVPVAELGAVRGRVADMYETRGGAHFKLPILGEDDFLRTSIAGMGAVGPIRGLGLLYEALLAGRANEIGVSPATLNRMTTTARSGMKDERYGGAIRWGPGFITDRRFLAGVRGGEQLFGHDGRRCALAFADVTRGLVLSAVATGLTDPLANHHRFRAVVEAVYDAAGVPPPGRLVDRRKPNSRQGRTDLETAQ